MRPTAEATVARLRLNPCVRGASIRPPLAHASKPTPEERHGQGSDAQQQGKEEAEGGLEQEEKGRSRPLAVRVGTGAAPAWPESLRQEELAARPIDDEGPAPERSGKASGHKASATPRQSFCLPQNDAHTFSTSGDSHYPPDCPRSPSPCGCHGRTVRDTAGGYTPR